MSLTRCPEPLEEKQPHSIRDPPPDFTVDTEPECFICRDVEVQDDDPLRKFCDCKNLLAHQVCLSAWIQKGSGNDDRLRCIACKAKYQLQWSPPWRLMSANCKTWLVLITVSVLMILVPYVVHCMVTAFADPPPPITFKLAAASFGLLTEILLIKFLSSFLSCRYRQAKQSSFTVRARGLDEDRTNPDPEAAGHVPPAASSSQDQERKGDVLRSWCLLLFCYSQGECME